MAYLGEEGTEQFTVETKLDGAVIRSQPIHDPFIHSTIILKLDRWSAFKQFFRPTAIKVEVAVWGTHAAQRRIMTMDPEEMQRENAEYESADRPYPIDGVQVPGARVGIVSDAPTTAEYRGER